MSRVFPFAAEANGEWWVLRMNDFPEHPLFTLFIDGEAICDLDDPPETWRLRPHESLPVLDGATRATVLEAMRSFGPYGSEVGTPCDGDWCTCSILTPTYVSELVPPSDAPPESSS